MIVAEQKCHFFSSGMRSLKSYPCFSRWPYTHTRTSHSNGPNGFKRKENMMLSGKSDGEDRGEGEQEEIKR